MTKSTRVPLSESELKQINSGVITQALKDKASLYLFKIDKSLIVTANAREPLLARIGTAPSSISDSRILAYNKYLSSPDACTETETDMALTHAYENKLGTPEELAAIEAYLFDPTKI